MNDDVMLLEDRIIIDETGPRVVLCDTYEISDHLMFASFLLRERQEQYDVNTLLESVATLGREIGMYNKGVQWFYADPVIQSTYTDANATHYAHRKKERSQDQFYDGLHMLLGSVQQIYFDTVELADSDAVWQCCADELNMVIEHMHGMHMYLRQESSIASMPTRSSSPCSSHTSLLSWEERDWE